MSYDISVGNYKLGMLDRVEVRKSVEQLADTAVITLPSAEYNVALDVESKVRRGDAVTIKFGYKETGVITEFTGWVQRISTDGGNIKIECEDDLFLFRKPLKNEVLQRISLQSLLEYIVKQCGVAFEVECAYTWAYAKFVINNATGMDVLKKIQDECGADIFIKDDKLYVMPPGATVGKDRYYDFARNIEQESLTYKKAEDKKILVVVKANMPDGTVKELEIGSTGGEKVEVKAPNSDDASMKLRGEVELKRRNFDGYEGSITGWLIPECEPGDSVTLHDKDYEYKDGTYFVTGVTTEFSREGGKRKIELGFRLS